ncbi:MAG: acetyl-CoA carboxylase biotin carboxyl carrier protein subunit [Bacteroidales bacterium]|nr:acetyl-CoA carboxylase biotin carboxyl carrier protein subunit [Bacteroidales bacterium]
MSLESNVDDQAVTLELLKRDGNTLKVRVDDIEYTLDLGMVERGVHSILYKGKSYNVELVEAEHSKKYVINTYKKSYEVEVVDAEAKYMKNRKKPLLEGSENSIISPMPGKVVKIPVEVGEEVKKGQTVIIVSAMKMENEYKSTVDGIVKQILVKEDDTVDGNQPLVILE